VGCNRSGNRFRGLHLDGRFSRRRVVQESLMEFEIKALEQLVASSGVEAFNQLVNEIFGLKADQAE
jgi:hypothetical protein